MISEIFHYGRDHVSYCRTLRDVCKARLFGDIKTEKQILQETEPEKVRDLGRQISPFDRKIWDDHKFNLVCDGNRAKFTDPELQDVLLATGDRLLVEASPLDKIWGIGFDAEEAPHKYDDWAQNLMGLTITRVRDEIRKDHQLSKVLHL